MCAVRVAGDLGSSGRDNAYGAVQRCARNIAPVWGSSATNGRHARVVSLLTSLMLALSVSAAFAQSQARVALAELLADITEAARTIGAILQQVGDRRKA